MSTIKLKTQDWIYNAGLVGFINVLNHSNANCVKIKSNFIEFDISEINNFETKYFDYFIFKYEKTLNLYHIINYKDYINNFKQDLNEENYKDKISKLNEYITYVKDKSSSNSYKRVYKFFNIEEKALSLIKELKSITLNKKETYEDVSLKIDNQLEILKEVIQTLEPEDIKRLIYIQLIKFNVINKILDNVSFLNKQFKGNDEVEYARYFVESTKEYLNSDHSNYKYNCICCDNKIKGVSKPQSFTLTWLKKVGVDEVRKSSNFWNCNPNAFACPLCNLIFSCIPIGFNFKNNEGYFFNTNTSVNSLLSFNKSLFDKYSDDIPNSKIKNLLLDNYTNEKIYDMQVITIDANDDKFKVNFNLLNHNQLKFIGENNNKLKTLTNKYVHYNKDITINLYDEVYKLIENNQNFYKLIDLLLKLDTHIYSAFNILQLNYSFLKEVKMKDIGVSEKMMWAANKQGLSLKRKYIAQKCENKLDSNIYKMRMALKKKNVYDFLDILIYMYQYIGEEMSNLFVNCLYVENPDRFFILAYSFLMGLNNKEEETKKEENKKEGENKDA